MCLWPGSTGHVCLDGDTTPQDNGKTRKECVRRTYLPDVFGFAPMFVFAGAEGWCIREEFRPGKQHGQKGATALLRAAVQDLRSLGVESILFRLDSAFDAAENYAMAREEGVDFLVKGNPAHVRWNWLEEVQALPGRAWTRTGRNRRETYLSRLETRQFEGRQIPVRRILKITKRLMWELEDVPPGQRLLLRRWPKYEMETWVTSLDLPGEKLFGLYCEHATAEMYHSQGAHSHGSFSPPRSDHGCWRLFRSFRSRETSAASARKRRRLGRSSLHFVRIKFRWTHP